MTRASLAAFKQTVTVAWPLHAKRDGKALLVRTAKQGHARIMRDAAARGGGVPSFEAFANQPGRPVEAVILPGPIVYKYRYLREVVVAALAALRAASPVRSGRYRESHTLYIDGVAFRSVPREIPPGADVMIANSVPYARRLEIGKTESGRAFVIQVPDRIYERTAKKLQGRFRNLAKLTFSYATLPGAHTIKGGLKPSYSIGEGRRRQRRQQVGKAVKAPAIVIRML
jgi:hypothetical protein